VTSDTGPLSLYFRLDPTGRLLMGGRGQFREPKTRRDYVHLEVAVRRLFPHLGDVEFEFRWGGRVAITRDFLPHLHQPAPGILACLGYSGRGVAMATTLGKLIAAYVTDPGSHPLPLPFAAIRPIPFHGLHKAHIGVIVAWHRFCDALTAGRRRGRSSLGSPPEAG
jgi:glycine/D-amino acid oxidase-like deaminating enzyme